MATKSLGQLTIDLIAKIGGFLEPLDKAGRQAKKKADEISRSLSAIGTAIAGVATAAGAGLVAMTTNLADSAKKIKNFSALSNASTEEFQKLSFAAERYGIQQDKVADILKDVNDKIGDFMQTGGGALKDFFDNIAPKVGVTAEQFKKLSGPQALQLYVKSLEDAGASQQDMTFYLEAIASDSTALLPLLRDNGKLLSDLGDEAERTGNVISDLEIISLGEITASVDELKSAFSGMSKEVVLAAIPAVKDLVKALSDPKNIESAKSLGNAVITTVSVATKGVLALVAAVRSFSEGLAAYIHGPALGDLERLNEGLVSAREKLAKLEEIQSRGSRSNAGRQQRQQAIDDQKKEIARLEKLIELSKELNESSPDQTPSDTNLPPVFIPPSGGNRGNLGGKKPPAPKKDPVVFYGPPIELFKAQKSAQAVIDDINKQALAIQDSLKSEEEKIKESYERRREIVLNNTQITGDAQAELLKKLDTQLYEDLGDLNKGYWESYLEAAQENLGNFDELAGNVLENFSSRFGDAFESMVFDAENLRDAFANLAEGMARSVVNALGEMAGQWLAYQAVQLLVGKTTKAAAAPAQVSNALLAQQQAALNAFASTAAIPIVGPAFAPAAAAAAVAATSPFVAAISGLAVAGVAHEGLDKIPQTGTWLLEKGERVTSAKTSAKMDRVLSDIQSKVGGETKYYVINQTKGRVDNVTEQRISPTERALILQEAEDRVSASVLNPNSRMSRNLAASTTTGRVR